MTSAPCTPSASNSLSWPSVSTEPSFEPITLYRHPSSSQPPTGALADKSARLFVVSYFVVFRLSESCPKTAPTEPKSPPSDRPACQMRPLARRFMPPGLPIALPWGHFGPFWGGFFVGLGTFGDNAPGGSPRAAASPAMQRPRALSPLAAYAAKSAGWGLLDVPQNSPKTAPRTPPSRT